MSFVKPFGIAKAYGKANVDYDFADKLDAAIEEAYANKNFDDGEWLKAVRYELSHGIISVSEAKRKASL